MKKIILLAAGMVAAGSFLQAQNSKPGKGIAGRHKNNRYYVDANKNNLCGNFENNTRKVIGKGTGYFAGAAVNCRQCSQPGCGRRNGNRGNKGS